MSVSAHGALARVQKRTRCRCFRRRGVRFCTRCSPARVFSDTKVPIRTPGCLFLHTELQRVCKYGQETADSDAEMSVSAHGPPTRVQIRTRRCRFDHRVVRFCTRTDRSRTSHWPPRHERDHRVRTCPDQLAQQQGRTHENNLSHYPRLQKGRRLFPTVPYVPPRLLDSEFLQRNEQVRFVFWQRITRQGEEQTLPRIQTHAIYLPRESASLNL